MTTEPNKTVASDIDVATKSTEQMIEEALKIVDSYNPTGDPYLTFRASKGYIEIFEDGEWGASELFQENIAKLFNLIATKSAEEELNKIGNLINSTRNDIEKLDLVVKYLNKDTNE